MRDKMRTPIDEFSLFEKVAALREVLNRRHLRPVARTRSGSTPAHVDTLRRQPFELPSEALERGKLKLALCPEGYPEFDPRLRKLGLEVDQLEDMAEEQLSKLEQTGRGKAIGRLPVFYEKLRGALDA